MPLKSPFPLLHIPDNISLPDLILSKAGLYGDRISVVDGPTRRKFTYKQFAHMVRCMAASMHQRGLRKGDVVFILSPNCIEVVVVIVALTSLGAVITSVNPLSTEGELEVYLSDTKPSWLISHTMVCDPVIKAANKVGNVKERYVIGPSKEGRPIGDLLDDSAGQPPRVQINPREDVAFILYSSGTTGRPKGVLFTHYHAISYLYAVGRPEVSFKSIEGPENHISILPMFHVSGLFNTLAFMCCGDTSIMFPRFDFEEYLQATQDYKPKSLFIVPPIAVLLAKHPVVDKFHLESVKTILIGSAPISRHTELECRRRLNLNYFRQGYGMTECGPLTHGIPWGINKPGSVGVMLPNVECKVMDVGSGREFGVNEDGELWVKSPGIMKGYLNRPEATAEAITPDGFYKTGDIGHYDADGYFYIVDRLKELIKYKGFQVAPADLEALLLSHPAVADVAVIGIPDEAAGELPRAYVVKKEGAELNDKDLVDFVAEHAAPHKRIRGGVVFLNEVPKSPSGKILRKILREQMKKDMIQHEKAKL